MIKKSVCDGKRADFQIIFAICVLWCWTLRTWVLSIFFFFFCCHNNLLIGLKKSADAAYDLKHVDDAGNVVFLLVEISGVYRNEPKQARLAAFP